ncbi:MAG: ABC transporter ATP-binding protein [SAR324 cluster bacterium]
MDSAVCASRKRSAAVAATPQRRPVLEVRGLSKRFGGVQAVHGVGFDLHAGEVLAMIGPNGAGKTTCFNMLMGQLSPDAGSVRFEGRELVGMEAWRVWRLGVGRTFQITATFASMTVLENVQLALASHRRRLNALVPRLTALYAEPARELLSRVGMADQAQRACGVLAYGDLKRVELAMALANEPRLLLMDEPTAGMAPAERAALMALTRAIVQERGTSVLFTEHDMDVVFTHADRILVLNRGERIAFGTPEAVRGDPRVQEVYLGSWAVPGGRAGERGGAS